MLLGERVKPYLYLAPALGMFLVFTAYPVTRSIQMSFQNYEFLRPQNAQYVGLDNYKEALSLHPQVERNDPKTRLAMGNTLRFTAMFLPFYVLLPIPVAFLIDRLVRGQAFMRVTTFLPIVVSGAVIAVLWTTLYHPTIGPFSQFMKWLAASTSWDRFYLMLPLPALAVFCCFSSAKGVARRVAWAAMPPLALGVGAGLLCILLGWLHVSLPAAAVWALGHWAYLLVPWFLLGLAVSFWGDPSRRGRIVVMLLAAGVLDVVLYWCLYPEPRAWLSAAVAWAAGHPDWASESAGWLSGFGAWAGAHAGLLANEDTAMPGLVFMSVWHGLGFNVLMYLVTLANIPNDLYEAAAVDGATRWGTFWNVTLPLLRPAIYLVTVLGTIGSLKVFGPMFIMTGGGPANTTVSLVQYIYQTAFTFAPFRFGYAASLAFLLAIVVLVFAITASRLNRPVDR